MIAHGDHYAGADLKRASENFAIDLVFDLEFVAGVVFDRDQIEFELARLGPIVQVGDHRRVEADVDGADPTVFGSPAILKAREILANSAPWHKSERRVIPIADFRESDEGENAIVGITDARSPGLIVAVTLR